MKFPLHLATLQLLKGLKGIELGAAAHNPFGVDSVNVAPYLPTERKFDENQLKLCGEIAPVDLRGHAADIPVEDNSQDFVLSSHVLEHVPDLLRAFAEMARVVRPGGYIVIVFPQPTAHPGDVGHPHSTLEDVLRAYREEWTFETAPASVGRHQWIMSCVQFMKLVQTFCQGWTLIDVENPDRKVGNGFWLAYQLEEKA